MADEPANLVLEHLRHMRGMLERLTADNSENRARLGRLEVALAQIQVTLAEHSTRFDRVDGRLDRIERRLDLVDAPIA